MLLCGLNSLGIYEQVMVILLAYQRKSLIYDVLSFCASYLDEKVLSFQRPDAEWYNGLTQKLGWNSGRRIRGIRI